MCQKKPVLDMECDQYLFFFWGGGVAPVLLPDKIKERALQNKIWMG